MRRLNRILLAPPSRTIKALRHGTLRDRSQYSRLTELRRWQMTLSITSDMVRTRVPQYYDLASEEDVPKASIKIYAVGQSKEA